jgi:hypothetical protein
MAESTPESEGESVRERLIRTGRLLPGHGDALDVKPLSPVPGQPLPSEVLAQMRDDGR